MNAEIYHVLLQPSTNRPIKWYERAARAREVMDQFPGFTFSHLEWESYAWPGGYEVYYLVRDGGVLCHQCANEHLNRTIDPEDWEWYIVAANTMYEGVDYCDHCSRAISADTPEELK